MTTHAAPSQEPAFVFHHGHGASMWQLADGEADLVLTSPPYFTATVEQELRRPIERQQRLEEVEDDVTGFALSLQPIFLEIARILKPSGKLIVQTRDLRYGGFLIGPMDTHRRLAEASGFRLMTEIAWQSSPAGASRYRAMQAMWRSGQFVTSDVEKFLVFATDIPVAIRSRSDQRPPREWTDPLWRLPAQGARTTHPFESPLSVLRRLVDLYSEPGDLVVDPLCGHGTTVLAAVEHRRLGVGFDIDPDCIDAANRRLERHVLTSGSGS